jgi:sulfate/thiosulfate transport system substrate-binding protein
MRALRRSVLGGLLCAGLACSHEPGHSTRTLLNVSFDSTRELYQEIDAAFASQWLVTTGETVNVEQSHGGSGKQARAVLEGLEADVVTLALAYDIDALHTRRDLLPADWQDRLPDGSCPYTSAVVFVVRRGNPRGIRDWDDLARPGVSVITPNPKTSGGGRWSYLAAWGWAAEHYGGDDAKVRAYMSALYQNVPVLDSGSRGSVTTFGQRHLGDVLIAWESEALRLRHELSEGEVILVRPSSSILAEPPVALVDRYADAHGTRELAERYLLFLYGPDAQEIIARNFFRPRDAAALARHADLFPPMRLFTVEDRFGGWTKAQKTHFAEGGTFDQIYRAAR